MENASSTLVPLALGKVIRKAKGTHFCMESEALLVLEPVKTWEGLGQASLQLCSSCSGFSRSEHSWGVLLGQSSAGQVSSPCPQRRLSTLDIESRMDIDRMEKLSRTCI
jgi:hypothetical protein